MQSLFYTYTSPHRLFHPAAKRNTLSESAHNPTFKVARTSCQCCSTCQAQNGLSVLAATVLPEGINVALCKWSTVIIRAFSVDCYRGAALLNCRLIMCSLIPYSFRRVFG